MGGSSTSTSNGLDLTSLAGQTFGPARVRNAGEPESIPIIPASGPNLFGDAVKGFLGGAKSYQPTAAMQTPKAAQMQSLWGQNKPLPSAYMPAGQKMDINSLLAQLRQNQTV